MSRTCLCCGADIGRRPVKCVYCGPRCRQRHHYRAWARRQAVAGLRWYPAPKRCVGCDGVFTPTSPTHKWCSDKCRKLGSAHALLPPGQESLAQVEARFQAALRAVRASQRYRLSDEGAWSQAAGWAEHLQRHTPDVEGLYLLADRTSKAKHRQAARHG